MMRQNKPNMGRDPKTRKRNRYRRRDPRSRRGKGDVNTQPGAKGKAPDSGRDKKPEEKQIVVDLDDRIKRRITNYCSIFLQNQLNDMLPHLNITFKPVNVSCLNQTCVFVGKWANYLALKQLASLISFDQPLLDIGMSVYNMKNKKVHGVCFNRDVYSIAKLIRLEEDYPNHRLSFHAQDELPPRSVYVTPKKWTYCRCPPAECSHIELFGAALFNHTGYHFTPTEIAEVLYRKTSSKRGISIHHNFVGKMGHIYRSNKREYEMTYRVKKDKVRVRMQHCGGPKTFEQGSMRWLYESNNALPVDIDGGYTYKEMSWQEADDNELEYTEINGPHSLEIKERSSDPDRTVRVRGERCHVPLWLTWKHFKIEESNGTLGVTFHVIDRSPTFPLTQLKNPNLRPFIKAALSTQPKFECCSRTDKVNVVLPEPIAFNDEFMEGVRTADLVDIIKHNPRYSLYQIFERPNFMIEMSMSRGVMPVTYTIPISLIIKGIRHLSTKPINTKTRKDLGAYIKKQSRPEDYKDLGVSDWSMAMSIEMIVDICCDETMRAAFRRNDWFTPAKAMQILRYNRSLGLEIPSWWKYALIVFLVLISIVIITSFFSVATLWIPGIGIISSIVLALSIMLGTVLVGAFALFWFGPAALIALIPGVSCGVGTVTTNLEWIMAFVALIFIFKIIKILWNDIKYRPWNDFKRSVEIELRTIEVEGAVPFLSTLRTSETLIDIRDYPKKKGAKFELRFEDERVHTDDTAGPGALVLGPVFNCFAPNVYSSSQHNSIVSCFTRVLLETPNQADAKYYGFWFNYVNRYLLGPTGMYQSDIGRPRSRIESFTLPGFGNDNVFTAPPPCTWDYYINRFPPSKRSRIQKTRDQYNEGLWSKKQLVYEIFIKRELNFSAISREAFTALRPRAIQGCSGLAKAITGPWFLDYSYALKYTLNPTTGAWYCSGYTSDVFTWWFNHHIFRLGGIENLIFLYADFSKYDVTQGVVCIRNENSFYRILGITRCKGGKDVLQSKLKTRGFGKGYKYSVDGLRKSGDNDTSSGNSRTTFGAFYSFFCKVLFVIFVDYAMALLGDDNMTILNRKLVDKYGRTKFIDDLQGHMRRLGFSVKVRLTTNPLSAEFLSMRPYIVGDLYVFGRKPGRCLIKLGYFVYKTPRSAEDWLPLLKATLISMLPTGNHVPFLRIYLKVLLSCLTHVKAGKLDMQDLARQGKIYEATDETFAQFYELYQLTRQDESEFEKELIQGIRKYGITCLLTSDHVAKMATIDADPFLNE